MRWLLILTASILLPGCFGEKNLPLDREEEVDPQDFREDENLPADLNQDSAS